MGQLYLGLLLFGISTSMLLLWVPPRPWQGSAPLGGVLLNGVATSAYIGAGLGPGACEGLTTGWAARGHHYEEDADARLRS